MLKEKLLKELSAHRECYLSGQELAEQFGVSRGAVWKAVKALEREGYAVEAGTNKGYRLSENALCAFDLKLPDERTQVFYRNTIDSTNSEAKRLLAGGLSGNAFVVANEQSAGRGRCGRSFYSPKDSGLYFSYIFHPQKCLSDAVFITTAAAVSVVRAIEKTSEVKPLIKWVNDVYVGDKKICGILTEAVSDFESGNLESVIVGIGINVSTTEFPEDIGVAASLGGAVSRPALLQAVAEELIKVSEDLQNATILDDYRAHSLVLGKEITYSFNGEQERGKAVEINDAGALVVMTKQGLRTLSSGEISIRW